MAGTVVRPKGTKVGSVDWLRTKADLAKTWAESTDRDARQMVKYLSDLRAHDWKALVCGKDDWPQFCRDVLAKDPEFIEFLEAGVAVLDGKPTVGEAVRKGREVVAARAENPAEMPGQGARTDLKPSANGTKSRGQNHADYLTARIARDHPAILDRMKAGEFKSVRAAAIEAGIVKPPPPLALLQRAWAKASKQEKDAFMDWVNESGW